MAEQSCSRKLIVEVCNANNLMPKDGQGTASAYAIVDFDGQRRRTKTKFRDLNPQWDERLEFLVQDTESMVSETLELNVYNDKKTGKRSTFLGKVKISGSTFAKAGSEALVYYPLEKRSVFSQIKGEIGLKIWYVDDLVTSPPPPAKEEKPEAAEPPQPAEAEEKPKEKEEEKKIAEVAEKKNDEAENKNPEEKKPAEDKKKEEQPPEDKGAAATDPPAAAVPPVKAEEQAPLSQTPQKSQNEKAVIGEKDLEMIRLDVDKNISSIDRRMALDLVDQMPFLYVRVVKAKLTSPPAGSSTYAKLVIGTHAIKTNSHVCDGKAWDQVFAFDKESLNSTQLEISIWVEKKAAENENSELSLGMALFDLREVPKRVPPDSPLAP